MAKTIEERNKESEDEWHLFTRSIRSIGGGKEKKARKKKGERQGMDIVRIYIYRGVLL